MDILCLVLQVAYYGIIVWVVLRLVTQFGRLNTSHPVTRLVDALGSVIEPVLRPIRSVIPPVRMGGSVGLDLSPLVLFFGLGILMRVVC